MDSNTTQSPADLVPDSALQLWSQKVSSNPDYAQSTPQEQTDTKDAFFKKYVAPTLGDDSHVAPAYVAFDFATSSPTDLYSNTHFTEASEATKRDILRKNLIASGQDPDAITRPAGQTPTFDADSVPMGMPAQTAVDKAYQAYRADPNTHTRALNQLGNELMSPVNGLAQVGAVINPFLSKDQQQNLLNTIKSNDDARTAGEKEFPEDKIFGYAAQAVPAIASGGIGGGIEGVAGVAARAAGAGLVAGSTSVSDSTNPEQIATDKATTGAVAAGLSGLTEAIAKPLLNAGQSVYAKLFPDSSVANAVNAKAAQKAVQSAAEDLAKVNGTTVEQELANASQQMATADPTQLTATNSDLMDLATKKLANKSSLTEKQQANLTAAIQTKLSATSPASVSSASIAQDVSDANATGAAARDAVNAQAVSDIDQKAYGVNTGTKTAAPALLKKVNDTAAANQAASHAQYVAEVAPAEAATVGTYADAQKILDNAQLEGGVALSSAPDLKDAGQNTVAYKNISKYVPDSGPAVASANPEYAKLVQQYGPDAPKLAQAVGISPTVDAAAQTAEQTPMSLGALNRNIKQLKTQLSNKLGDSDMNPDVIKAQIKSLSDWKQDFLDSNPDVADVVGQADKNYAQRKVQMTQSSIDLGGNKAQSSVVSGILDKAQSGKLSESDLNSLFESDNHAQTLSDFKKAVGNDPETQGQISDAFHNWIQDKLPDGTAQQKLNAVNKLLGAKNNNDFPALAAQIPTGEGRTALDDLSDIKDSLTKDVNKQQALKSNIGVAPKDTPYISVLTKNKNSSESVNNLINEPQTLADAGLHFGQPGYGKDLQAGAQNDVLTDMKSLAQDPKALLNKYTSSNGQKMLDVVFQGNTQDRQLVDQALQDAQKYADTSNISEFRKGGEPLGPVVTAAGHAVLPGKTTVITKAFNAISDRLMQAQQEQLQKVLTNAQFAKQVTDKVAMGMSRADAVQQAYEKIRPAITAASTYTATQNANARSSKPTSILDQPLPKVNLPKASFTPTTD